MKTNERLIVGTGQIKHIFIGKRLQSLMLALFLVGGGIIGVISVTSSHAQTPTASIEPETGVLTGPGSTLNDSSASNGSAILFHSATVATANPSADAGATLPISYNVSSLSGTVVYVAPSGSDSASGSVSAPYATLAKAITAAPSGGTIVLRGGTYRQGGIAVNKSLKIIAYPGETPVFNGATPVSGGWTVSGSTSYRPYTPMPVTDGSGISFSSCGNQTGSCVGKYPDQAWVGGGQLQQVSSQAAVTSGTFYVDTANNRIYLDTDDVNKGSVEVSGQRTFASVSAPNVTLQGFRIIRYSNTASDYGAINFNGYADNGLLQDMFVSDTAFIALTFAPSGTNLNANSTIRDSTVVYSNWMGVSANATDDFTLAHDDISNMNQFGEFTASPQSGSLKTSRTWHTKVLNSKIMNDKSHGLWFDQSNYDAEVAGNDIENNTGTGLFFEISDYLYAVNNYFKNNGRNHIEVSGSSDAFIVNNTMVGGADQIGVYVDSRSQPGCSDPNQALCSGSYNSDRDTYHTHLATMTWIPGIDMIANNIFAYPTGSGYCSTNNGLCITQKNGNANVPINTIIHPADGANGVPQTVIDGNVYANGSGNIIDTVALGNFTTTSAFASAMAGSPVSISGVEAHGRTGNANLNSDGSPTGTLSPLHSSAYSIPTNSYLNPYISAGTKHYGVLWR